MTVILRLSYNYKYWYRRVEWPAILPTGSHILFDEGKDKGLNYFVVGYVWDDPVNLILVDVAHYDEESIPHDSARYFQSLGFGQVEDYRHLSK